MSSEDMDADDDKPDDDDDESGVVKSSFAGEPDADDGVAMPRPLYPVLDPALPGATGELLLLLDDCGERPS